MVTYAKTEFGVIRAKQLTVAQSCHHRSSLTVPVCLVQFRQQRLEHPGVVDQLRAAQREVQLRQIPRDLAAHPRRRHVRDVRQPVHERFRAERQARVRQDECTKGVRNVEATLLGGGIIYMRVVRMTVLRLRMMARKSWVN